jgi:hypothetical protein
MKKLIQSALITVLFLLLAACETVKPTSTDEVANALPAVTGIKAGDTQNTSKGDLKPSSVVGATKSGDPDVQSIRFKPEQMLAEGAELYDKGDFKGAIRKLVTVRDSTDVAPTIKQNTLRLLAFSYCVTSQRALCKNQFSTLLSIAPDFELSRGEAGHPLWGPVFKEAKIEKSNKASKMPAKG